MTTSIPSQIMNLNAQRDFLVKENDVIIDEISITSSGGLSSSLLGAVTSLVLYEDILKNFMTGYLMIVDASDIMRSVPIEGKEIVKIRYRTPINADVKEVTMRVVGQTERNPSQRSDVIILRLLSPSGYKDRTTLVSKSYRGSNSEIASSLVNDYYNKSLFFNNTDGSFTRAFTYNTPSKIINRLAKSSVPTESDVSEAASGFVFYETASGFHFKSLSEMFRKGAVTFYLNSKVSRVGIEQDNLLTQFRNMNNVKFFEGFPRLKHIDAGAYNSLQYSFDPTTVSWNLSKHSYLDGFLYKTNDVTINPLLSPDDSDNFTPSRVFLNNQAKQTLDPDQPASSEYVDIDTNTISKQHAKSNYATMDSFSLEFTAQGNSILEAGDVISLLFTRNVPDSALDDGEYDPNLSGSYLIRALNNQFNFAPDGTQEHIATLNCVKNSRGEASVSSSRLAVE